MSEKRPTLSSRSIVDDRHELRRGFTIPELIIVTAIMALLASIMVVALAQVREDAQGTRTRSQVARINSLLNIRLDSYRTRQLHVTLELYEVGGNKVYIDRTTPLMPETFSDGDGNLLFTAGETYNDVNGNGRYDNGIARIRLFTLREIMRLELPDRITDVLDLTVDNPDTYDSVLSPNGISLPSVAREYARRRQRIEDPDLNGTKDNVWTPQYQGAECLYMILASMQDGSTNGLDFFRDNELGDADNDGMKEVHDAWGNPIEFIRWPAGLRLYPGIDDAWGIVADDDNDGTNNNTAEAGMGGVIVQVDSTNRDLWARTTIHDVSVPDGYDLLAADPRWRDDPSTLTTPNTNLNNDPFALTPLIYSAGPNEEYDVISDLDTSSSIALDANDQTAAGSRLAYSLVIGTITNDPYASFTTGGLTLQLGARMDLVDPDRDGYIDNIDNHFDTNEEL